MALDPPIIELALSLNFVPVTGLTVRDMVAVYEDGFAQDYPTFQQVQRVDAMVVGPPKTPVTNIQMMTGLEMPRLWFVSSDTKDLVQLQDDRIVLNWRRLGPQEGAHEYPGYEVSRHKFRRCFETAWEALNKRGINGPTLVSGELAYINLIPLAVESRTRRIAEVLAFYRQSDPPVAVAGFQAMWMEEVEAGWIHLTAGVGSRPDNSPAISLTISGRFEIAESNLDEALNRFDIMHNNIHKTFRRVVTQPISEAAYA